MPTVSSVTAPVLRTSPSTSHLNAEVSAADRRRNELEDSPMSPISPGARLAPSPRAEPRGGDGEVARIRIFGPRFAQRTGGPMI